MAAIMLVSLCAVSASTLGVSAAQGSSPTLKPPRVVGAPVGAGAPGVCTNNSTDLFLFIRGADNALYLKISPDGVTWPSTETSLGGVLASAPAATSPGNGVIEVFVRGTDARLYEKASVRPWGSLGRPPGSLSAGNSSRTQALALCSWASPAQPYNAYRVVRHRH